MAKYWIFQTNPRIFDIDKAINELKEDFWTVRQHKDLVEAGDIAFYWKSGTGIIGLGRILTSPSEIELPLKLRKYWKIPPKSWKETRVKITYDYILKRPILRKNLLKDDALKNMTIIEAPQGTNFRMREYEVERLLDNYLTEINQTNLEEILTGCYSVDDRLNPVLIRTKQQTFRSVILSNYNNRCCVCGLDNPELLVASHIIPWSRDKNNRLNPSNGLCLCVLHDKCFDRGFISLTNDYKILVSSQLKKSKSELISNSIIRYSGRQINLPVKYRPDIKFIEYHRKNIFKP